MSDEHSLHRASPEYREMVASSAKLKHYACASGTHLVPQLPPSGRARSRGEVGRSGGSDERRSATPSAFRREPLRQFALTIALEPFGFDQTAAQRGGRLLPDSPLEQRGDSNSWSHSERQRSEGASRRPPFNSLDRVRTRLFAGEKRIRTCPVTAPVLRLPQARGDYHSAAECLSSC
jgi:hypothetical protein